MRLQNTPWGHEGWLSSPSLTEGVAEAGAAGPTHSPGAFLSPHPLLYNATNFFADPTASLLTF